MKVQKLVKFAFFSFIYALGFQLFIAPAGLLATGFSGIAQIIVYLSPANLHLTYAVVYFVINIPGFILGYKTIGKEFALYTVFTVFLMSFFTQIVASLTPTLAFTNDIILQCVFGGLLMGYAVGSILKLGASSGGVDVIGLYLLKKKRVNFGQVNLLINGLIVLSAMYFFGIEVGLYTLLSLYVRNLTIKYVFTNNDLVTLFIITEDSRVIEKLVTMVLHRGVTIMDGYGGYTHTHKDVMMTTLNQYEYRLFVNYLDTYVDSPVFINIIDTRGIVGNYDIGKNDDIQI